MVYALQLFLVIGIPLLIIAAYQLWAQRLKDTTVYMIGLINTIHIVLCPALIVAATFWAHDDVSSLLIFLALLYLFTAAPVATAAFLYYLLVHRRPGDSYAIFSSFIHVAIFGLAPWGAFLILAIFAR